MYETQVARAVAAARTELQEAITSTHSDVDGGTLLACFDEADSFLTQALQRLADSLAGRLRTEGTQALAGVVMGDHSNFLTRAALDLIGPCLCAADLAKRGEWSIKDRYQQVGVKHALGGVARNLVGAVYGLGETATDRVWRYMNQIADAHVGYAAQVLGHVHQDRTLLNNAYGVTGTLERMNFTGSDPHQGAQRVILMRFSDGQRVVYKPTDLTFQLLLMGDEVSYLVSRRQHSVLQVHSQSLFGALGMDLPLMRIVARPASVGHYGYMQFISKSEVIPANRHAAYFRKLGKLGAVAAIFGITDLHEENVMATAEGPWLIDAEMGFAYPPGNANRFGHSCLQRVFRVAPPQYNILGGCFFADFDARYGFSAETVSVPHDANEVNAGFRAVNGGPFVDAHPYAADVLAGVYEGVEGVAARMVDVGRWFGQFSTVKPFARLLLNTSDMTRNHVAGVTDLLNGTLQTRDQAVGSSLRDWLVWFGGHHGAVPGAWYQPHSRQTLHDPSGQPGVSYAMATAQGVSVATLQDVRNRVSALGQPARVAELKRALKADLEQALGGGNIWSAPPRARGGNTVQRQLKPVRQLGGPSSL